jgi:hypothetical protein
MSLACELLSPPASKDDQGPSTPLEIHAIAGAVVDSQFRDALAGRLHISWIPSAEPLNPGLNAGSRPQITEVVKPPSEGLSLSNLDHSEL